MANYTDISPLEFQEKIQKTINAQVIDCRTTPEIMEFKLEYNYHIDVMKPDFPEILTNLDKNKPYLIYCRSGSRSAFLCDFMSKQGFSELYNLAGGVIAWRNTIK